MTVKSDWIADGKVIAAMVTLRGIRMTRSPRFRAPSPLQLGSALAVVAAVLAVTVLPTDTSGSTSDRPSSVPATASPTSRPSPANAPLDGDLVIVESGHSLFPGASGRRELSWGAVITNTATVLLAEGTASIEMTAAGERVSMNDPIPLLAPGSTAVVGLTLPPPDGKVTDMRVVITAVRWWTADAPASIVATDVEGGVDDYGLILRFRVESGFDDMVFTPRYHALFRDEDGDILGASLGFSSGDRLPPGWSIREIEFQGIPAPGTVQDAIEVFVAPQYG